MVTEPSQPQATTETTTTPATATSSSTATSQQSTGAGTEASGWQDAGSVLGKSLIGHNMCEERGGPFLGIPPSLHFDWTVIYMYVFCIYGSKVDLTVISYM